MSLGKFIDLKLDKMKKVQDFIIYPNCEDGLARLQSDNRAVKVNLNTGEYIGVKTNNHPSFSLLVKPNMQGVITKEELKLLTNLLCDTRSKNIINTGDAVTTLLVN